MTLVRFVGPDPVVLSGRRVLYVTIQNPFPPDSGGKLRDAELIRRLSVRDQVHVAAATTTLQTDSRYAEAAVEHCASLTLAAAEPERQDGTRRYFSADLARWLAAEHRRRPFDVVHVEGYYCLDVVSGLVDVPVALVVENIEHRIETMLQGAGVRPRRDPDVTRLDEEALWTTADAVGAISGEDLAWLRRADIAEARLVPNGSDHDMPDGEPPPGPGTGALGFLGRFDYPPSADAAGYLCKEVFPLVCERLPTVRLLLAGYSANERLMTDLSQRPGVQYLGPVARAGDFLAQLDVFVAPLRAGGGMKVKISEALAWGRPIVTTPIGAQGFPAAGPTSGMYVATDPRSLAGAVVDLLESAEQRMAAAAATRTYWRGLPTWDDAARAVVELWDSAVRMHRSTSAVGGAPR